ncbi:MAG: class I SAM-dependent RNA methyltransferase [Pseudomonadota bacterium]
MTAQLELFLVAVPGLEHILAEEARAAGFTVTATIAGGVTLKGGWSDVWRANLVLRGPTRVLARIGAFPVFHLAQLDKRARKFPWSETLRADASLRVEVTTRKSKIYHAGAARQRIEKAIQDTLGIKVTDAAPLTLKARIDDNVCTFSIDTSGEPLHKRGFKQAVGKAPMRETMAALFLRACGYDGTETVLDPMCGSGTFVIEAAEIAAGLAPGRARSFAFEELASFDRAAWRDLKSVSAPHDTNLRFYGSDRDAGAISNSTQNAKAAGVSKLIKFAHHAISDLTRPDGPPGLVIFNPPYGGRIGNTKLLYALHRALGETLRNRFQGWRVGLITNENGLARATGLPWKPLGPPVAHGGLKVRLFQTKPL